MDNKELSDLIERLAVEIVLIEHTDHEEFDNILNMFSGIKKWAEENAQDRLKTAIAKCVSALQSIRSFSDPHPKSTFAIINKTISEIQHHSRHDFNFARASFPEALNQIAAISQTDLQLKNDTSLENKPELSLTKENSGLLHPDKLPSYMGYDLFAEFLSLQGIVLDKIESLILSIENQNDKTSITEFKRLIHTTKGEAGFLNLNEVEQLCHLIEDLLDSPSPADYTDIFFEAIDWLRKTFTRYMGKGKQPEPSTGITEQIKEVVRIKHETQTASPALNALTDNIKNELLKNQSIVYQYPEITGNFISDSQAKLVDCLLILSKIKPDKIETVTPDFNSDREKGRLLDLQYRVTEMKGLTTALSLFEAKYLISQIHRVIDTLIRGESNSNNDYITLLNDAFIELRQLLEAYKSALEKRSLIILSDSLTIILARLKTIQKNGEVGISTTTAKKDNNTSGKTKIICETSIKQEPLFRDTPKIKESIAVDAERLDKIIDMIGELVVAESMVVQSEEIKSIKTQTFARHLSHMTKITRGLQETGLSLRMLPIKATFQKMARVVRDTAKKSDKRVNFLMYGEETELDKSVIDKIGDPLLHMIRNAIDHGIEKSSEDRIKNNKSTVATVIIRAFHKGGNIQIEVEDDGIGLDSQAIMTKALARNIVDENTILTDREMQNLIFEPGFSTAQSVTDLSGRGVGLNIVKSNIEDLHGRVDIKTETGKGTVFIIKIPLTLAIIDGMVVSANNEKYIIPTLSIVTSLKLDKKKYSLVFGKGEMIDVQGRLVPLFSLSSLFNGKDAADFPENALIVVVEEGHQRVAILVDDLLGKQQIVIKSLGEGMNNISGISGGAIMPDGKVGLIIDIASLIFSANNN